MIETENHAVSPPVQVHLVKRTFPGPGSLPLFGRQETRKYFPLHFALFFWGVRLFGVLLRPAGGVLLLNTRTYTYILPIYLYLL